MAHVLHKMVKVATGTRLYEVKITYVVLFAPKKAGGIIAIFLFDVKFGKPDRWVNLITIRILSFWFTGRGCGVHQSNSCVSQSETGYLSVRKTPIDQRCYIPHQIIDVDLDGVLTNFCKML